MRLYFFYTMVQKSQKWPKTQIKGGGSCLNTSVLPEACFEAVFRTHGSICVHQPTKTYSGDQRWGKMPPPPPARLTLYESILMNTSRSTNPWKFAQVLRWIPIDPGFGGFGLTQLSQLQAWLCVSLRVMSPCLTWSTSVFQRCFCEAHCQENGCPMGPSPKFVEAQRNEQI